MNETSLVGWTLSPHKRGTIDLIWSCLLVIFTATWTVIHLNLPAKDEGFGTRLSRKLRWATLAVLAPDLVTLTSAAQWKSATDSVLHMHNLGYKTWTLEHGFYADSGGFRLVSSDYPDFPITAASIRYLVKGGYMECPSITRDEIWDKSKADKFAKGFALIQSAWLVLQTITRASQGLSISPLELFTIAFVVSTVMSYFFWFHKPQHVSVPTYVKLSSGDGSIATILKEAGDKAATPWTDTPFDFIEKPLQIWKRREMLQRFDLQERPLQRLPNDTVTPDRLVDMGWRVKVLIVGPSTLHSIIHLLGWNFVFPTRIEQNLWRVASLILTCGLPVTLIGERILRAVGCGGQPSLVWIWVQPEQHEEGKRNQIIDAWGVFVAAWMVVARLYIIAEVMASLRGLPADVYTQVDWTTFIPHV